MTSCGVFMIHNYRKRDCRHGAVPSAVVPVTIRFSVAGEEEPGP
jgi:hypothetical protein